MASGCTDTCTQHFYFEDIPDPLKMYYTKDGVEKFIEKIEDKVKWLYATYLQQPMIELTDVLKWEYKAAEKWHIF